MRNILRELRASLTRNASMTVSLIVTMSVSLMLASLGLLIQAQADRTERYFGDRLQVQVTMCTDNSPDESCVGGAATDEQKQAVKEALSANAEVKSFTVRTSQQNYDRAKALYGQSDAGKRRLAGIDASAFPESYLVTLVDPQKTSGLSSQLEGTPGVSAVTSLRDQLEPLFVMLSKLRWAALGTSLMLIIAAILQVSNTIRMTAFARRREIGIMRLVGASSWHIQLPFVLESMVAAVISAVIAALGMTGFMYTVVYGYLRSKEALSQITTWVTWHDALTVMGWSTVLAVALALVPTLIMTRRYLKV